MFKGEELIGLSKLLGKMGQVDPETKETVRVLECILIDDPCPKLHNLF